MSATGKHGIPPKLRSELESAGAEVRESRDIDHGTQHRVSLGSDVITINVYSSGKTAEGGKESLLKEIARSYRISSGSPRKGWAKPAKSKGGKVSPTIPNDTPRVGTDEAGKGEYFGPLVVAGVRVVGRRQDEALRAAGVRDSKDLGTSEARRIAAGVREVAGEENLYVLCLSPREYEDRWHGAGKNVNRLLGELNVEVIRKLQSEVEVAVVDQFGVKAQEYIEAGGIAGVRIEARPRAEDDAAVAAASILARARYLEEMDVLSEGTGFTLPRGSTHVMEAATRVYEKHGEEGLRDVAKFHFSITDRVVGR